MMILNTNTPTKNEQKSIPLLREIRGVLNENKQHFKIKITPIISLFFIILTSVLLSSCTVKYGLTGASISPEIKTISIKYFDSRAPLAKPTLSNTFTEALKDQFQSQTNLSLVSKYGDLQFEGYISEYRTAPVAITGNETAAKNRLTISVHVKYINSVDNKQNFDTSFTRYAEYDSSNDLTAIEDDLIKEINEQLVQDIFNKSVSNW